MADDIVLKGVVASGTGEGKYFMMIDEYVRQFKNMLQFRPYAGTLNIMLDPESVRAFQALRAEKGMRIEGFKTDRESFGGVSLFWAELSGTRCAVVIPDKSRYTSIIEVISDQNLRKAMSLDDGERVELTVHLKK